MRFVLFEEQGRHTLSAHVWEDAPVRGQEGKYVQNCHGVQGNIGISSENNELNPHQMPSPEDEQKLLSVIGT